MTTNQLETCPMTKISATYKNTSFDRNAVDLIIAIITTVDNKTNIGFGSYRLLMEKTRMSKPTLMETLASLRENGVITTVLQGNNLIKQATKYKLNTSKLNEHYTVYKKKDLKDKIDITEAPVSSSKLPEPVIEPTLCPEPIKAVTEPHRASESIPETTVKPVVAKPVVAEPAVAETRQTQAQKMELFFALEATKTQEVKAETSVSDKPDLSAITQREPGTLAGGFTFRRTHKTV